MANQAEQPSMFDDIMAAQLTFFDKHKKTIISAVIAALVIVAAVSTWQWWKNSQQLAASEAMFQAQEYFASGDYDKALNGDATGAAGFLSVADEYSSAKAGNMALLYAGVCYAKMEKWQEAIDRLEDFSAEDDMMVSPAALGALGNAYANTDQNDKAVSLLEKAASKADNNTLSPLYLIQAGEIYEAMNNKEAALKCYQTIKSKYQRSPQWQEIDKYIERASK